MNIFLFLKVMMKKINVLTFPFSEVMIGFNLYKIKCKQPESLIYNRLLIFCRRYVQNRMERHARKIQNRKRRRVLMIRSGDAGSEKVQCGLYKSMGFLETYSQPRPRKIRFDKLKKWSILSKAFPRHTRQILL